MKFEDKRRVTCLALGPAWFLSGECIYYTYDNILKYEISNKTLHNLITYQ